MSMRGREKKRKARRARKAKDEALHFSPLSNGLDFLLAGLEVLGGEPGPRQVKYAVLHVAAGISLVHKELLYRKHWAFIFDDVRAATRERYESGDFRSVDFEACLQRLEGICGISIDEETRRRLRSLIRRRNRIEHFGISEPLMVAKASVSAVLGHTVAFVDEHLAPLGAEDADVMEEIRRLLGTFEKFVQDRWKEIENDVQERGKQTTVVECPRCSQEALLIDGGPLCQFCAYKADPNEAADEYLTNVMGLSEYAIVKGGGEWPRYECPDCEMEAMVARDDDYVCFCCGRRFDARDIDYCPRCGQPYEPGHGDDYDPLCSSCWAHIASKD